MALLCVGAGAGALLEPPVLMEDEEAGAGQCTGESLLVSGLVIGLGDPRNMEVTAAIKPRPKY